MTAPSANSMARAETTIASIAPRGEIAVNSGRDSSLTDASVGDFIQHREKSVSVR